MTRNTYTEDTDSGRSNGWVALSNVRASLADFIGDIDHAGRLDVRIPPGTVQVERDGHEWAMALYGTGGGFCWSESGCSKRRVLRYIGHYEENSELELRRIEA